MSADELGRMQQILAGQRADFTAAMPEALSVRQDRIDRAIAMMVEHKHAFAAAASADFGHRSTVQTLTGDVMTSVGALRHARKHMKAWSRGEKRSAMFPFGLVGGKARVEYKPKGVVGVIAPWNFPIGMVMVPLAGILAAGNRAMIKPSEFTERVADLFAELVPQYFAETEIAVFTGGVEVGTAFSGLAFDHLIFTGATSVGKHIMRAAAENLVPVTLELGGKSPTIIGRSADLAQASERIIMGKMMNAGQICLAPDYLLVAREQEAAVIEGLRSAASTFYPSLLHNDDYTSVVNTRNRDRLLGYLDDARAKGAELVEINPAAEDFAGSNGNKMPLTLVRNADDGMKVMQEEIFGPILPILTYERIEQAIDYVNAHDRPLGFYYFGKDRAEEERVLARTISGGVTINDTLFHNAMEDLPFGGIGPSGMGNYHGADGFRTFSHARAVYRQAWLDVVKLAGMRPPFGKGAWAQLKRELGE
ncbi:MAG: coniferyl aldehyde dehydrogenase [Novosphingobium sp.]